MPQYIIQARVTAIQEKYACCHCGENAQFREVSYELITQENNALLARELEGVKTLAEAEARLQSSPAEDAVFDATVAEQQQRGGPVEHSHMYLCFHCEEWVIDNVTHIQGSGILMLMKVIRQPEQNALFIARAISEPTKALCFKTDYQDVQRCYTELHAGILNVIPKVKIHRIR